jgi:hypothetical protein
MNTLYYKGALQYKIDESDYIVSFVIYFIGTHTLNTQYFFTLCLKKDATCVKILI